jgi:hypothetical protein
MKSNMIRLILIQLLSFLQSLQFAFGQTPQLGDLIELQGAFFARSSAQFRAIDNNKITVLRKGAKGQIMEVKPLSSGAYGICIKVFPRPGTSSHNIHGPDDCVWVYYKAEQNLIRVTPSNMTVLPTVEVTASVPEVTNQAEALSDVQGIPDSAMDKAVEDSEVEAEASVIPALIEDTVSALQSLGQSSASVRCTDCDAEVAMNYARCDAQTSNVDQDLRRLLQSRQWLSRALKSSEDITGQKLRVSCVNKIQANSSLGKSYASGCSSGEQALSRNLLSSQKTCASQLYSEFTTQSFNLIHQCTSPHLGFGNSEQNRLIKDMAALITQESHFHHNAVNAGSLAAGLGQLFPAAIIDVNTQPGGRVDILNRMKQSERAECQDLADYLLTHPLSGSVGKTCQTVSLESGNPLTNLFYSFAYMGINRSYTERLITDSLANLKALSPDVKSKMELDLSLLSHNAGIGNVKSATLLALREFLSRNRVVNSRNYPRFLETISRKLGRAEQRSYLSDLQNSYRRLGGDACFQ